MNRYRIELGDCRDGLRRLAAEGVRAQTCVTSPPYFGLRDYGHDGQIGLEGTPDEYIAVLIEVFRCVRDVLADDGTLWLNIGDSYAGSWGAQGKRETPGEISRNSIRNHPKRAANTGTVRGAGLKPKDLIGVPWMLAFALRADGWYLRQDIIWHKPNPMPESVRDRCTKAHEYLFLLSKNERYYLDSEAMQEPAAPASIARWKQNVEQQAGSDRVPGKTNGPMKAVGGPRSRRDSFKRDESKRAEVIPGQSYATHRADREGSSWDTATRNRRSVWTVATRPYRGAHFAAFPPALIEPCILAGSRPGDLVLDPFGGCGTTAGVALAHGRDAVLCELNPAYADLVPDRVASVVAGIRALRGSADVDPRQVDMFPLQHQAPASRTTATGAPTHGRHDLAEAEQ